MTLTNGNFSTTEKVWEILTASKNGNINTVKKLVDECPDLVYAQYNYTPPIHFAVREGHLELVKYLLKKGAYDPNYKTYPFLETLITIANDRGYPEIENLLVEYSANPDQQKYYKGDSGKIQYPRTELQIEFEKVVDEGNLQRTEQILNEHPEFAEDETYFWGEGILVFAAKENNR